MNNAIEFEYGPVKGVLLKFLAPPLFLVLGVVLIVAAFAAVFYAETGSLERYLGPFVLPPIGGLFLRLAGLYFESRHAFTTRYAIHEGGIEVHPKGELPRFVAWTDIDEVVVWRFYQWCQVSARTLEKTIVISNAKGDIKQTDYWAGLALIQRNVHVAVDLRMF